MGKREGGGEIERSTGEESWLSLQEVTHYYFFICSFFFSACLFFKYLDLNECMTQENSGVLLSLFETFFFQQVHSPLNAQRNLIVFYIIGVAVPDVRLRLPSPGETPAVRI